MAEHRSPAPSVPEIKDMTLAELFTQAARMQGSIARINTTLAFLQDPIRRRQPEKALQQHERALANIAAELAARYVSSDDARRTFLFKLMGEVAMASRAYFEGLDSEKDNYYEQEYLKDLILENLKQLDSLR